MRGLILKTSLTKTIFFWGNSHMNYGGGLLVSGGQMPKVAYAAIVAGGYGYAMQNYSVGGKQTIQMISDFPTILKPYLKKGDVVFFDEGPNNMAPPGGNRTAAQTIADTITIAGLVTGTGAKLIIAATTPHNVNGGNEANYATYDSYMLSNHLSFAHGYCNYRSLTGFQTIADTANTANFEPDTNHSTNVGYAIKGNFAATTITPLLTL